MAQANATAAIEALSILARTLLTGGQPFQAIKCLEAVCRSSAQMPVAAAKTRLWVSRLLLQHTQNISEATQHLQQAQLLIKQVPACFSLKCEVLSELGRCQRYLARPKLELQAYERAMQVCTQGQRSSEREALQQWQAHFGQRLMDIHVVQGNLQDAQRCLDQALQQTVQSDNISTQVVCSSHLRSAVMKYSPLFSALSIVSAAQVVLHLAQLQLHMLSQDIAAATQVLSTCTALMVHLAQGPQQQPLYSQLQLHFCILRVVVMIHEGQYVDLLKTGEADSSNLAVSEMEQLLEQIGGREWGYVWLPTAAVQALVGWLAATIYRPPGRFKQAMVYFSQAQQAIDEELRRQRIGVQGTEDDLPLQTVCNHHTLLYIKFLIIEGATLVHLTQIELVKAQKDMAVLLDLCTAHPALLGKPMQSSLHLLTGHYAMAAGDPAAAAVRFVAAAQTSPTPNQARLAAVAAALALLATDHPDNITKAAQILQQHDIFTGIDATLPYAERSGAMFASAMVLIGQGKDQEGKLRLHSVLKYAHHYLGSHQLVSQLLSILGPSQMQKGDMMGAQSMLQSSFTLSKGLHDLPTMLAAVQGIMKYHEKTGDTEGYNANVQFTDRKSTEYLQQIQLAQSTQIHSTIMQWQGFN